MLIVKHKYYCHQNTIRIMQIYFADLPIVITPVLLCECVIFCVNICCQVAKILEKITYMDSNISSRMA